MTMPEHNTTQYLRNRVVLVVISLLTMALSGCASSLSMESASGSAQNPERRAVQTDPLTPEQQGRMDSARSAMAAGQWAQAGAVLEKLKADRPNVSEIHASLGWVARNKGDNSLAVTHYEKAFELNPNDAASANNLALLLKENNRFREAVTVLEEGLRYSPDTADLHYNLAVIAELYLLDYAKALNHYRRYRDLASQEGQLVAGWIADLERRLD